MLTQERYEIVKKWGNYIFLFHKTEANPSSRERFKKLLQKLTETGEFTWQTNAQTKTVEIAFPLGQIHVRVANQYYDVSMDQETKNALQNFKEQSVVSVGQEETKETSPGNNPQTVQNNENVVAMPPASVPEKEPSEEPKGESVFLDFLTPKEGWM